MKKVLAQKLWSYRCPYCNEVRYLKGKPAFHGEPIDCPECGRVSEVAPVGPNSEAKELGKSNNTGSKGEKASPQICPACRGTTRRIVSVVPYKEVKCNQCNGTGKLLTAEPL